MSLNIYQYVEVARWRAIGRIVVPVLIAVWIDEGFP